MSRPSRVALNGVFGAGLSTTVLPVPSACPSLLIVTSNGKFHGTIAPTTPTGFPPTLAGGQRAGEADQLVAQVGLPRVLVDQPGGILQPVFQWGIQLRAEGD